MEMETQEQISHQQRRQELGNFLISRRARLSPQAVGFIVGSRRRTPGLRRAEVAQLAGVSVDWYTWLEQGRPINVSAQVLESLVKALQLSSNERAHLFFLAHQQPPPTTPTLPTVVSPVLQRFLDQLGSYPAYVTNEAWNVVGWNRAACMVFGDFEKLSPRERNIVRITFTSRELRAMSPEWERNAQRIVAQFRASYAKMSGDPLLTELVSDLERVSPEFAGWWNNQEVVSAPEGLKIYNHPLVGRLAFEYIMFHFSETTELKVTIYNPVDEEETTLNLVRLLTGGAL